jgi:hypothetical protein
VDRGRLADVRAEIATSPPELERAALRPLQLGLVALGHRRDVDDIADRLAELGQAADRYLSYASVLGEMGDHRLALAYVKLAADRGFAELARIDADEHLVEVRSRPDFEAIRERVLTNARSTVSPTDPPLSPGASEESIGRPPRGTGGHVR